MFSWRDFYLTHCALATVIHVIALGGSFLQLDLCFLHLFLNGVCEEFGNKLASVLSLHFIEDPVATYGWSSTLFILTTYP
jgi:hypothetical protein